MFFDLSHELVIPPHATATLRDEVSRLKETECAAALKRKKIVLSPTFVAKTVGESVKQCPTVMRLLNPIPHCVICNAECLVTKITKCPQSVHRDHNEGPRRVYTLAFSLEDRALGTQFSRTGDGTTDMVDCRTASLIYDAHVNHRGCAEVEERYDRIFITFASATDLALPRISRACLFSLKAQYVDLNGEFHKRKLKKNTMLTNSDREN